MAHREFFAGGNFSGRSAALLALLRSGVIGKSAFLVGPYAEAALSGLTSSVADELLLYRAMPARLRPAFARLELPDLMARKPQSLSGGEQVLLALHCFSLSTYDTLAIDTALEQLDTDNRAAALAYLDSGTFHAALIDNRAQPSGWAYREPRHDNLAFAIDWAALSAAIEPRQAPEILVSGLHFHYRTGKPIFHDAALALTPGHAHRLAGENGAGKSTLLKILVGALAPQAGDIRLGGDSYAPWRDGNRALALAMQNPDQQWCGATLREDMARRRNALARDPADAAQNAAVARGAASAQRAAPMDEARLTALAQAFGLASLDQHLYELPLAARKRVSWLWPLTGVHPWIMLDEPTIGQDRDTRENLARLLARVCAAGTGVIFVTHDEDFAALLAHRVVRIERGAISPG